MGKYIVIDNEGIIHESDDFDAAKEEFDTTENWNGDLRFLEVKELNRKH